MDFRSCIQVSKKLNNLHFNFAERVEALETVWFLGDEFCHDSFEVHFKRNNNIGYLKENFGITGYFTTKYMSHDQNTISRLRNSLAAAIREKTYLPKYVVIVPDDDIMKYAKVAKLDSSQKSVERLISAVMKQHNKYISIHKENLPRRAKRELYPQFIWIEAPINTAFANNAARIKFNASLNHVAKFQQNMTVIQLKKIWDTEDPNYYVHDSRRFTVEGYSKYWEAVNASVKFMDTILIKKIAKKSSKNAHNGTKATNFKVGSVPNKYKWVNDQVKSQHHNESHSRPEYEERNLQEGQRYQRSHGRPERSRYDDNLADEMPQKRRRYPTPPPRRRRDY